MSIKPTGCELGVGLFTASYIIVFTAWFLSIGNYEFIIYVATMVALVLLVAISLRSAEFPPAMLWALSFWGLAHMAGGGLATQLLRLHARLILFDHPSSRQICFTNRLSGNE